MNEFVDLYPDIDAKRAELLPKFTNSAARKNEKKLN